MNKKLTKHGNSLALVIDKPILELLGIDAMTLLSITTDGKCLFITPTSTPARAKRMRAGLKRVQKTYGKLLKRLASK